MNPAVAPRAERAPRSRVLSSSGLSRSRQARVLHAAVMVSALTATLVLAALRTIGAGPIGAPPPVPPGIMRVAAIVLLAGATVVLRLLRATFPPLQGDGDAWWPANLGRAVAIWALADGAAIAGGVAFLLVGDGLVLALAVAWAVAMFVRYTPGRLTNG